MTRYFLALHFLAAFFLVGIVIPSAAKAAPTRSSNAQWFGVSAHFMWQPLAQTRTDLDRIRAAGIMSVRYDINWKDLEPNKGLWNISYLTKLDTVLAEMDARGLKSIFLFSETPGWARGFMGTKLTPPTEPEDYGHAAGYLARHLAARPNVVYELWDEPNDAHFWNTPTGPDPVLYTRMLRAAYTEIKTADPDATVLGGSLAFNDLPYLDGMYAAGARGYFDALSLHPYNQGHAPGWIEAGQEWYSFPLTITQMKQRMADHGEPDKAIWITELGWSTAKVDDATRATYFAEAVAMVRDWPYVKSFVAYGLNQADDPPYGLIGLDSRPTASWTGYASAVAAKSSSKVRAVIPQQKATYLPVLHN